MMHPDSHLHLHRQREAELHGRLLRQARSGELARNVAESRIDVRRGFLVRMWGRRQNVRPAPASLEP